MGGWVGGLFPIREGDQGNVIKKNAPNHTSPKPSTVGLLGLKFHISKQGKTFVLWVAAEGILSRRL
jgi:hypothetical protein